MITLVEALNYRCLRYVRQPLGPFHVLVGPNASGKTTFLDVVAFLGSLVADGLDSTILRRTQNFQDLVWGRQGRRFDLALEARIPEKFRTLLSDENFDTIRYEAAIGLDQQTDETSILWEKGLLKESRPGLVAERSLFPESLSAPESLGTPKGGSGSRTIFNKVAGGNDNFYSEVYGESGKGWAPAFKLGPRKSTLAIYRRTSRSSRSRPG